MKEINVKVIKVRTNKQNKAFVYGLKTGYYCGTTNSVDNGYHLNFVNEFSRILASTDDELGLPIIPQSFINDYMICNGKIKNTKIKITQKLELC